MKILIILQHIFPMSSPRAHRTTELIKEFARLGHNVEVFAVLGKYDYSHFIKEFPNVTLTNIPLKWMYFPYNSDGLKKRYLIDKITYKFLGKLLEFPNIEFYKRTQEILKDKSGIDLLISIAEPHPIHWGIASFRRKNPTIFPKKWIADCGDPYMHNGNKKLHPFYFSFFEHLFCTQADYISLPIAEAQTEYFQEYKHKFRIIPQGFDFDKSIIHTTIPKSSKNIKIKFAYAGLLHKEYRNPNIFLDFLVQSRFDFEFHIFSQDAKVFYRNDEKNRIFFNNAINKEKLIPILQEMDFVVNFENTNLPGQKPSKLIEYSILRKPILNINPLNPNREITTQFLMGDFTNGLIINDLEKYHISNIANQFIQLLDE